METFRLKSMTDFVLEQIEVKQSTSEFKESVKNYAKFLNQPLKLEMFVPCDEDGYILEEPEVDKEEIYENITQIFAQYQYELDKAKENILFEGFENSTIDELKIMFKTCKLNIIEDFLNYKEEIQLTENAVKQIGL